MIQIKRSDDRFLIEFLRKDLSDDFFLKLLRDLEFEKLAAKNRMTTEQAWQLSEDIKESWWAENKARILDLIGVDNTVQY